MQEGHKIEKDIVATGIAVTQGPPTLPPKSYLHNWQLSALIGANKFLKISQFVRRPNWHLNSLNLIGDIKLIINKVVSPLRSKDDGKQ